MPSANHLSYQGLLLPDQPTIEDVREVASDYVAMIHRVMSYIADRYEKSDYPGLIDTKFNIITGEDFPSNDLRGPKTVYGWIQGRGLEALVGHAVWLQRHPWADVDGRLVDRLDGMIRDVYARLRSTWKNIGERLFFFMDPMGEPFVFADGGRKQAITLTSESPYNFSDLFGSRGLYAAACYLQDTDGIQEAADYCIAFENALWNNNFASDQQQLPPATSPAQPQGRFSHAPFTIQLATPALMATEQNDLNGIRRGLRIIEHVLAGYVNLNMTEPQLNRHDFWEFTDAQGRPYLDDGRLILDPGHALEFVGLGLKLTRAARSLGTPADEVVPYESAMAGILDQSFQHGYYPPAGGIYKQIDLLTKQPLDDTMPWWSLPETMRSAIFSWSVTADDALRQQALSIFASCHNSFITHYVRPERHLFAVQTRSTKGEVIDVIPATADADPGYHTGLSLLDVLDVIEEATGPLQDRS